MIILIIVEDIAVYTKYEKKERVINGIMISGRICTGLLPLGLYPFGLLPISSMPENQIYPSLK